MEDKTIIANGSTADIYRYNDKVLKKFNPTFPNSWIQYEASIQKEVSLNTYLNVPHCEYNEKEHGIIMDTIEGITLADRMRKDKYKQGLEDLINLQLQVHEFSNLNLENVHDVLPNVIENLNLPDDLKQKAKTILDSIEKRSNLCHFDFHFYNIMFDGNTYFIIDWMNAKLGNPVLDIARTYVILKQYMQRQAEKYLRTICKQSNTDIKDVRKAVPLIAILRLEESDSESFKESLYSLI